ncbi:MAG: capsule assembly Wzi family protein [Longimicrobiales bacterium]|nr:capsule assembly Wzi family protein [Longimicrobiales bacterium]
MTLTSPLLGQASTDLAPESQAEWVVEKLVGFGLIDDRLVAIRPWSRSEALRMVEQARENLARLEGAERAAAERILDSLDESALLPGTRLTGTVEGSAMDSPWLPIPEDTGQGGIDAEVNYMARYRVGREYLDGQTLAGELDLDVAPGGRLSLQVRPRYWIGRDGSAGSGDGLQLLQAQARLQLSNLRIDVGRSTSLWGPGTHGGILLAANARGLDRIRLSSDAPFRLPSFLSVLGPTQAEIFLAVLEEDRDIPRSRMVGYNVAIRPHPRFEAWFSTLIQSGGEGAPEATAWERFADHVLLIDWIFNGGETFLFSNKGTSVGFQIRFPSLRHGQLYVDFTLEDKGHNPKRIFWQDGAWQWGLWFPRLDSEGRFDLRAEFVHSGYRMHRHGQFTSGRTLDRRLLGLGDVNTDGGFVEVGTNRPGVRASLQLGVENRRADVWANRYRSDGELDVMVKVEDRPDELYLRALASVAFYAEGGRELEVEAGLARVTDSRFQAGATRHDALLRVQARVPLLAGR